MNKTFNLKNIVAYIQGNIRYYLWYSKSKFINKNIIRKHIREQIEFRIRFMDNECYLNGSCKMCGCNTTALQMANKACDKPCYPEMMNKRQWFNFFYQNNHIQHIDNNGYWLYTHKSSNPKREEQLTVLIQGGGIKTIKPTNKEQLLKS